MIKKVLVLAALAAATAVPIAPASAAGFTHIGGCAFNSITDPTPDGTLGGQDAHNGQISGRVVVYNPDDAAANAGTSTLTCTVTVNGVAQDSASNSGVIVVAVADVLNYTAGTTDVVELCTKVDYPDSTSAEACVGSTTIRIPPQEVSDALTAVFDILIGVAEQIDAALADVFDALSQLERDLIDPLVCPVLAGLTPGIPGVVDITAEGDLYLAGEFIWDCPEYEV